MDAYHQQLLERADRAFNKQPIDAYAKRIKAIIGPPAEAYQGLAQQAMEALRNGETPTPKQLAALELVIRLMRPALLSKSRELENLDPEVAPSFPPWDDFRTSVKPFLYSIGRIDLLPQQAIGTGFLVSPDLLVTNKHVLNLLSHGTNVLEEGQAIVRFRYEYGIPDKEVVAIVGVVAVHPSLDIALLKLGEKDFTDERRPLVIDTTEVNTGHPVAAVGYPLDDPKRNPLFIGPIFGNRFGVKRTAPGEVIGRASQAIFHDCTTLGGNSGSPILSMENAQLVGIHSDGMFMYRNEAVNGASLNGFISPHLKG
jgi:V8-like Glu-specific endopeptidase